VATSPPWAISSYRLVVEIGKRPRVERSSRCVSAERSLSMRFWSMLGDLRKPSSSGTQVPGSMRPSPARSRGAITTRRTTTWPTSPTPQLPH
jgi:hypothetical protein